MKPTVLCLVFLMKSVFGESLKPDVEGSCNAIVEHETSGIVASPGFPRNNYTNDLLCKYEITVPVGMQIIFRSLYLNLELPGIGAERCFDAVNIHYVLGENTSWIEQYCGEDIIYEDATPENKLIVEFFTDNSVTAEGFAIKWNAMDRGKLPPQMDCAFDEGFALCPGWSQVTGEDDFDWSFTRGSTPTTGTGPEFDSNTGTNEGRYAFIEASNIVRGSVARLITPTLDGDVDYCLDFDYHAYGEGIGELAVIRRFGANEEEVLWASSELTDQVWWPVSITLLESFYPSQIVFEATRGQTFRSDLAIDDVTFTVGACAENGSTLDTGTQNQKTTQESPPASPQTSTELSVCDPGLFACLRSNACIALDRVCDDIIDCPQGSDEDGCFPEWCPGNMYWGGCVKGCNHTCEDGPVPPPCDTVCTSRCACPANLPVLHEGWCREFSDCPAELVNGAIIRQAKENVHVQILKLFTQIGDHIEEQS